LFPSTRWKAYLKKIRDNAAQDNDSQQTILHIYHSQDIWFAQERKKNDHQASAKENLKQSDAMLKDCSEQVEALETTLANTPKPSEMLDWDNMTLSDLM
jgi:uncharacterized damage-inducible protein DinB